MVFPNRKRGGEAPALVAKFAFTYIQNHHFGLVFRNLYYLGTTDRTTRESFVAATCREQSPPQIEHHRLHRYIRPLACPANSFIKLYMCHLQLDIPLVSQIKV